MFNSICNENDLDNFNEEKLFEHEQVKQKILQILGVTQMYPDDIYTHLKLMPKDNEWYCQLQKFYVKRSIETATLHRMKITGDMFIWFAKNQDWYKRLLNKLKEDVVYPENYLFNIMIDKATVSLNQLPYIFKFIIDKNNAKKFILQRIKYKMGVEVLESKEVYDFCKLDNYIKEYCDQTHPLNVCKTFNHLMSKENEQYICDKIEKLNCWHKVELEWFNHNYEYVKKRIFINNLLY